MKYYCACTSSGVYSPVACCCKHPVLILRSVTIKTFQENVDEKHTIFFSISLPTNDHATRSYTRLYSLALQEGTATLLINKTTRRRPENTFLYIGAAGRSINTTATRSTYERPSSAARPNNERENLNFLPNHSIDPFLHCSPRTVKCSKSRLFYFTITQLILI